MTLFLDAFLLALASSTDNFMVGLSVGISNQSLSVGANALISICNATGAWTACFGGGALGQSLPPHLPPLLSALAFGVLALKEFLDFLEVFRQKQRMLQKKKDGTSKENDDLSLVNINNTTSGGKNLNMSRAVHLAIPMTLNNLAGGVAGGAIGISPLQAGLYGLLASFLTMALGHWIGYYVARLSNKSRDETTIRSSLSTQFCLLLDPSFASGSLLGILSFMQFHEALSS